MIARRASHTPEEVAALLTGGPGERVVFAAPNIAPGKLAEALVALANAHGGLVLLGVGATGKPLGLAGPDEGRALAQEAGHLSTPPLILPLPQTAEHDGRVLCLIEVPPGLPHVYSANGRYLTRSGAANRLLSAPELGALLLTRSEAGFESHAAPGTTLGDLDLTQVAAYLSGLGQRWGNSEALELKPDREWQRLLAARGCLVDTDGGPTPTYAGILLFGREPQRCLRSAGMTLVRYAGPVMGDEFLREEATGTLPEQIRQAEAFVTANMRRGMRLSGLTRQEVTEYPLPVVREAIVNAAAHRDYAIRGDGIRVLMFSDHMEVYSPGRLPGHVTLDNMLTERFSRNEAIVQVLSDLGFVERLGYGIDRMVAAMAEAGLPPPIFEETVAGLRVALRGRGHDLVSAEPAPRWGNRRLNPRQERALAYLAEHGSITNREFRVLFPDLSDETIRRELADLTDEGLIVKVGDRKATYYILK